MADDLYSFAEAQANRDLAILLKERGACDRCRTMDACVPPEVQLRAMLTEDWSPADEAFHPRAMTHDQGVAAEMLTAALGRYVTAFGVELAGARLNSTRHVLRALVRTARAHARILKARTEINARARKAWERGDTDAMRAIEAEPTPNYPGKDRDDAWLGDGQPAATQLREVRG